MTYGTWLLFCGGYLSVTWAAKKRETAQAALCFFDGVYLAMLCFVLLPLAMDTPFFYGAAVLSAAGVAMGLLTERHLPKMGVAILFSGLVTALFLLDGRELTMEMAAALSFFSGMGLYHASAGILPEPIRIDRALLSAGGFLLGTVCFSPFL